MYKPNRISVNGSYELALLELDYSSYESLLDEIENSRFSTDPLKSISNFNRRFEWLSIRKLFLELGLKNHEIGYDNHGKPHLIPFESHISISHSKQRIAVGLSSTKPIGVDIQKISPAIDKIKHKYLNQEERKQFENEDESFLTKAWSAKEATFKANGKKDIYLKDNIEIVSTIKFSDRIQMETVLEYENVVSRHQVCVIEIDDYVFAYTLND